VGAAILEKRREPEMSCEELAELPGIGNASRSRALPTEVTARHDVLAPGALFPLAHDAFARLGRCCGPLSPVSRIGPGERRTARALLDAAQSAWYVVGMTSKIAISLPDQTLQRAKAAVRQGKARNVSNYIALLVDQASASESFEAMIEEWLRESNATPREIRRAEQRALADFHRAGLATAVKRPRSRRREEAQRKAG
jgi:hypothetical protein